MSQEKVDKYKKQKKDRKNPKNTNKVFSKIKKLIPYVIAGVVALLILGYLGISVAKQTGCYTPPTEARSWNSEEIASLRQVLIDQTDPNVQYTTAKPVKQKATKAVAHTKKSAEKTTKKSAK